LEGQMTETMEDDPSGCALFAAVMWRSSRRRSHDHHLVPVARRHPGRSAIDPRLYALDCPRAVSTLAASDDGAKATS